MSSKKYNQLTLNLNALDEKKLVEVMEYYKNKNIPITNSLVVRIALDMLHENTVQKGK